MIVINETEPGGEMVCILKFSARPRDEQNMPIADDRRTFHVGERVQYRRNFFEAMPEDNPTGYMVVFKAIDPDDPKDYAAAVDYFVTMECWEGLKKYLEIKGDKASRQPSSKPQPEMAIPLPPNAHGFDLKKASVELSLNKLKKSGVKEQGPGKTKTVGDHLKEVMGQKPGKFSAGKSTTKNVKK